MTALKINADYTNYLAFKLPMKDLLTKLGKTIPPKKLMHFYKYNIGLAETWSGVAGYFEPIEGVTKGNLVPDVSVWTSGTLVLSRTAKKRLEDLLTNQGEFLPVETENGLFWIFNCLTIVAADEEHSRRIEEAGQVLEVKSLFFREKDILANPVFKTDYDGYRSLFCNDAFQNTLNDKKLKGLTFNETLAGAF